MCIVPYKNAYIVHLEFPDKAIDENGYVGFWTMISNQGFLAIEILEYS